MAESSWWYRWVVELCGLGIPYGEALLLPWPEALSLTMAGRADRRDRLYDLSLAVRAGGADERGWVKWERLMKVAR